MEFKSCPKYKECNCYDSFVIRCNRCIAYKCYKLGLEKGKKLVERRKKND